MKKYIAEFVGTFVLITTGCGTAMTVGADSANGCGYLTVALAFGLAIVAMAYSIGNISGCHVNPAVSLAMLINGKLSAKDFVGYVVAQVLGATLGSLVLYLVFYQIGGMTDATGGLASSGAGAIVTKNKEIVALIMECVLTFIFLMAILGVTSDKAGHGSFGGIVIGLSLTLVHILGIGTSGAGINPARSLGPAIIAAATGVTTDAIAVVWVYIVGPLAGAALAAFCYRFLEKENK